LATRAKWEGTRLPKNRNLSSFVAPRKNGKYTIFLIINCHLFENSLKFGGEIGNMSTPKLLRGSYEFREV
jgi:hypothetical protein